MGAVFSKAAPAAVFERISTETPARGRLLQWLGFQEGVQKALQAVRQAGSHNLSAHMSYVAVRGKGDPHELVKRDVIPRRTHTTTITQNLDSVNTT